MTWCAIGVPAAVFSGYTPLLILGSARVAIMDKETSAGAYILLFTECSVQRTLSVVIYKVLRI